MTNIILLIFQLLFKQPDGDGVGSKYGYANDVWAMQGLACRPAKHIDYIAHICAHRTLPCGTMLVVENVRTNMYSWCMVMDRGPYGAILVDDDNQKTWTLKISASDPGRWRGILDMSPAVSNELNHNGLERIRYWVYNPLQTLQYMIRFYKQKIIQWKNTKQNISEL